MKQLNLYFSNDNSDTIRCMVINTSKTPSVEKVGNITFVNTNLKTYRKYKMLAVMVSRYNEHSWDTIDYGFNYHQFDTFKLAA